MSNKKTALSSCIAGTMRWGKWGSRFTIDQYEDMIRGCIDIGITSFDHADIYGDYTTEEEFGSVLKKYPSLRKKIQLITKCGIQKVSEQRPHHKIKSYNTSAEHIIKSVEHSLKNFGTDYIDFLLIHRPDHLMNAEEVAQAFTLLKEKGKVLHFGVSNFPASQMAMFHRYFPIETNQIRCSVFQLESFINGTLDYCQQEKIIPMAWSPLNAGSYSYDEDAEAARRINAIGSLLAEQYEVSREIIFLKWLQTHPSGILPVVGTTNLKRITDLQKLSKFQLSREEWYMLWRASTGEEVA